VIYEKPVFKPGGDRYMLIEFGDELNLALNFTAHSLGDAIAQSGMKAVIESAPCFASLLLHYEPDLISFSDLRREMVSLIDTLGSSAEIELPSRLFYFPTCYLDPWTKACVEDYSAKITPKKWDA
jgi:allophanate hydrolase subunit 1